MKEEKIVFTRNFKDRTDNYIISTIKATDRNEKQFETAISSRKSNGWKVVELYETLEESERGHKKWLQKVKIKSFDLDDCKLVFENYDLDESKVSVVDNLKQSTEREVSVGK